MTVVVTHSNLHTFHTHPFTFPTDGSPQHFRTLSCADDNIEPRDCPAPSMRYLRIYLPEGRYSRSEMADAQRCDDNSKWVQYVDSDIDRPE